jgi:folate-binding protein YgfZ
MQMETLSKIEVTGPDAFDFLQAQLTNDLSLLESESEILTAWCNPKGRVIWFGRIRSIDNGFALAVPTELAQDMVQRLTMFRFRSKVQFEVVDEEEAVDPAEMIRKGLPFIGEPQSEEFTPHMLNLDLLDAISMDKGCYPGQEIVARTHYKGATKRRTHRFESAAPVNPGDKISDGEREIGEVLNAAGNDLLAVIPSSQADDSLSIDEISLTHIPLDYHQGRQASVSDR